MMKAPEWTLERHALLRKRWGAGWSAIRIAAELGCFTHYADRGKNRVMLEVERLQTLAEINGKPEEAKFWARPKANEKRGPKTQPPTGSTAWRRSAKSRVAPSIPDTTSRVVAWPTDEEIRRETAKQIATAAKYGR